MRFATWSLIVALIAGHLLISVFVPQMFNRIGPDSEWLLAIMLGLCVGQVNLIAVWAAMAPGRVLLRLPWSILLATLMWYALVIGNRLSQGHSWDSGFPTEEALQLGLVILAGVMVAQIPLWAASRLMRWRLMPPVTASEKSDAGVDERQINLKHLLAGMLVVSIILALGRIVLPPGPIRVASLDKELTILLPAVGIVNLIVVMPCIWGAFAAVRYFIPLAFAWLAYAVIVTLMETAVLIGLLGAPGSGDIWLLMSLFNIAQCVAVIATLICLRGIGFRLMRKDTLPKPTCETLGDVR